MPIKQNPEGFRRHITASRTAATALAYLKGVQHFVAFLKDEEVDLETAPTGMLSDFVTYLREKDFSPSSVSLFDIGARRYLDWLRDQGEPVPVLKSPDVPDKEDREVVVLEPNDVARYLASVAKDTYEPIRTLLLLLPFTGFRVSEACQMELKHMVEAKDEQGVKFIAFRFAGKGGKIRIVPLAKRGSKILTMYLMGWRRTYDRKSSYIFPGQSGNHISARSIQETLSHIRKIINIEGLTPHMLRKTYCTELLRQGYPIERVARVMGHASIETTNRYYTKVKDEELMNLGNVNIGPSSKVRETQGSA